MRKTKGEVFFLLHPLITNTNTRSREALVVAPIIPTYPVQYVSFLSDIRNLVSFIYFFLANSSFIPALCFRTVPELVLVAFREVFLDRCGCVGFACYWMWGFQLRVVKGRLSVG